MIRPSSCPPFGQVIALDDRRDRPVIETLPVPARHHGRCPACHGAIRIDELIQRVSREWFHEECIPAGAIEGWPQQQEAA
jgi:hypothetical protein